jgi:hypothetical protein
MKMKKFNEYQTKVHVLADSMINFEKDIGWMCFRPKPPQFITCFQRENCCHRWLVDTLYLSSDKNRKRLKNAIVKLFLSCRETQWLEIIPKKPYSFLKQNRLEDKSQFIKICRISVLHWNYRVFIKS